MGAPEDLGRRIAAVEDKIQSFEFVHLVKIDATTAGLGTLYASQRRLEARIDEMHAALTADSALVRTEIESMKLDINTKLDEMLRLMRRDE